MRRSSPLAYQSVSILSLTVGVGILAATLTAGRELLFQDPPYPHPERLAAIEERAPDGNASGVALQNLLDFREQTKSFEGMAAFRLRTFGLRTEDPSAKTRVIQVGLVTWEFFETLGVDFARGRSFTLEEEIEEAPVIVVTPGLGGAARAKLLLNEEPRTIIDVLPEGSSGRAVLDDRFRLHYCDCMAPTPDWFGALPKAGRSSPVG